MSRLIPVEGTGPYTGQIVWTWDDPDLCPRRHPKPQRLWAPCPWCGVHMILWQCQRPDCGAVEVDDHGCTGLPAA